MKRGIPGFLLTLGFLIILSSAASAGQGFSLTVPAGGCIWTDPPVDEWGPPITLGIHNVPAGDLYLWLDGGTIPPGQLYWNETDDPATYTPITHSAGSPVRIPSSGNKEEVRIYMRSRINSGLQPGIYQSPLKIRYVHNQQTETLSVMCTIELTTRLALSVTPATLVLAALTGGDMPTGTACAHVTAGNSQTWQLSIWGSDFTYSGTSIFAFHAADLEFTYSGSSWIAMPDSAPGALVTSGSGSQSNVPVDFHIIDPLTKQAGSYSSRLWWQLVSP